MDAPLIPGFITRKQAAEVCGRSERTLQRYWSRTIERADAAVLTHLKLRTEDGRITEGAEVTKERIDALKNGRQNPTWFVHAEWVQKTFGPRAQIDDAEPPEQAPTPPASDGPAAATDVSLVAVMQAQIQELQRDKDRLHAELSIKNEQIKDANARTRESNILMQQLQTLLGNMQQHAYPALPGRAADGSFDADLVSEEGSGRPAPVRADASSPRATTTPRPAKSQAPRKAPTPKPQSKASPGPPQWYEMPTFKRLASRLRR